MSPSRRGMAVAILLVPALAAAQDDRPSEEELFGAPDEPAQAPQRPPPPSDPEAPTDPRGQTEPLSPVQEPTRDDVLGGGAVSEEEARSRLAEAYDRLSIGGLLYLTGEYQLKDDPLPEEDPLTSPDLLDLYLDGRPSDRVRGYTRLRLNYNPAIRRGQLDPRTGEVIPQTDFLLDQLWIKFDIERQLYLTVGKQRIKWGAGRFWNPTDFLNQERLDPLAVLDLRTGVYLLKLHYPLEALGWNVYAILNFQDVRTAQDVGGALRGEFLVGPAELALTAAVRQQSLTGADDVDPARVNDGPISVRLGIDGSSAVGPFDLRAEAAFVRGVTRPFVIERPGLARLLQVVEPTARGEAPDFGALAERRTEEWFPQVVVGAEIPFLYSEQDSITIGAEYFYNDAGYDFEEVSAAGASVPLLPLLVLTGGFEPLYVGRHYLAAYAALIAPGNLDTTSFILSAIANLSDESSVLRLDYRVSILQHLRFDAHVTGHFGSGELRPSFGTGDLPPLIGELVPAGLEGLAPNAEIGAGIALDL